VSDCGFAWEAPDGKCWCGAGSSDPRCRMKEPATDPHTARQDFERERAHGYGFAMPPSRYRTLDERRACLSAWTVSPDEREGWSK